MILDGKSSQEYSVNAGVPQGSILGPRLFLLYINDCPDVICDIAIYAGNSSLYSKCDRAPDLLRELELSNNNCSIDVKMSEFVLEEKSSSKMLGLIFSSKLD